MSANWSSPMILGARGRRCWKKIDGAVLFLTQGAAWLRAEPRRYEAFARLMNRGGGLVAIHWAMGTTRAEDVPAFVNLFGRCHGGPDRKYKFLETTLSPGKHPIATGVEPLTVEDEFYYELKSVEPADGLEPVAFADIEGQRHVVAWAYERPQGGRAAGFSGLHYHRSWRRIEYQRLVLQAVLWTQKIEIAKEGVELPALRDQDFALPDSPEGERTEE